MKIIVDIWYQNAMLFQKLTYVKILTSYLFSRLISFIYFEKFFCQIEDSFFEGKQKEYVRERTDSYSGGVQSIQK